MQRRSPIFISLIVIALLYANAVSGTGFRKYAGEFMSIDISPRAQALGGAFTALAADVTAAFYNPAGLVQVQSTQLAFMHTWQFVDFINYDYFGFSKPVSANKTIALSLIRLGVDDIKDTRKAQVVYGDDWRLDLSKVKSFNTADYVFFLSLGQRFRSNLNLGLNVKFIRRNLAESSAYGVGFDAGAQLQLNHRWKIGAMLRNLTSTLIAWSTGEKELVRPSMDIGSSYSLPIPALNSVFYPSVQFVLRTESLPNLSDNTVDIPGLRAGGYLEGAFGGELVFQNVLSLRGGVDALQRMNFGLGIKIPHLNIDYSFTSYDKELGNSHRIGLVVDFGG